MDHIIPDANLIHKKYDDISSAFFNLYVLHICGILYMTLRTFPMLIRIVINKSICEFELDCESLDIIGWGG